MALPFKNGMELAQAMGFGKMYMASKQEKENEVQMESRKMNNKVIRLTESDLHRIVKETVNRILRENDADYVSSGYADKDGEIMHNPKNGHTKKVPIDRSGKNRPQKQGDYVSSGYGDKDGEIFHNPKNGHVKRIPFNKY
jgi:hypothetical protein